jgi:hypothetical protein
MRGRGHAKLGHAALGSRELGVYITHTRDYRVWTKMPHCQTCVRLRTYSLAVLNAILSCTCQETARLPDFRQEFGQLHN